MKIPAAAGEASARWGRQLESWAIPDAIVRAAPESPWALPPELFARSAQRALADPESSPSTRAAAAAVPEGGTVLDVGAGGGAASLPLAPPAEVIIAVDETQAMLQTFAEAAEQRGITHLEIAGRWPDIESTAPTADVVVCHHVCYNVADLAPFLVALSSHARRRVVVELTDRHPHHDLAPLWKTLHGVDRPTGPRASDAAEVARALGFQVQVAPFEKPSPWRDLPWPERVAFTRRRLCVGPEHDREISDYLDRHADAPRELVTLWWDNPVSGQPNP